MIRDVVIICLCGSMVAAKVCRGMKTPSSVKESEGRDLHVYDTLRL